MKTLIISTNYSMLISQRIELEFYLHQFTTTKDKLCITYVHCDYGSSLTTSLATTSTENGLLNLEKQEFKYGSILEYHCGNLTSFSINNSPVIQTKCQWNGLWNDTISQPTCFCACKTCTVHVLCVSMNHKTSFRDPLWITPW